MPVKTEAWLADTFQGGALKNLHLTEYTIPDTKTDHVLIEMLNISVNPGDTKVVDLPFIKYLLKYPASIGFDYCGRICALPEQFNNERDLHVGQVVFGIHKATDDLGVLKKKMFVHKDSFVVVPENVPIDTASGLGVGAVTAWRAIAPYAQAGKKVLVIGGSGGVGVFCIQVGKALGMHVIATCSAAGDALCKELGADETLDYKSPTFEQDMRSLKVDLIVDNMGYDAQLHRKSEQFLHENGTFVLVGLMDWGRQGIQSMLASWLLPVWLGGVRRKWKAITAFKSSKVSDFEPVAKLAAEGNIKVIVDSTFEFEESLQAFERIQSGRAKGKIIVKIASPDNLTKL